MKIACIIPARLKSSRFPKKMIAPLHGKPLIQCVWEAAKAVPLFDSVTIALDALETAAVVESFGGNYKMTSEHWPTGTMRLTELIDQIDADIFVNWQGDEPFIQASLIDELLQSKHDGSDVWTLKKRITDPDLIQSPHCVKVVTDAKGYALYFSRSPIPYHRDFHETTYYKHVGIYAYSKKALRQIAQLPPAPLAEIEQLENLTFLYHGLKVRVHETQHEVFGIDIPEHLEKAHTNRRE